MTVCVSPDAGMGVRVEGAAGAAVGGSKGTYDLVTGFHDACNVECCFGIALKIIILF